MTILAACGRDFVCKSGALLSLEEILGYLNSTGMFELWNRIPSRGEASILGK